MKTATLAAILARDLLRSEPTRTSDAAECFACGRSFMPRPSTGDDNTHRFCSTRCREAFDDGFPPYNPDQFRELARTFDTSNLRVVAGPTGVTSCDPLQGSNQVSRGIKRHGSTGWVIECFGCGKEFESTGLRCCSPGCERRHRERSENAEVMARVGMERPVKRKCEAAGCGRDIPTWRNGRRVSKATKFCSDKCSRTSKKANQVSDSPDGVFDTQTAKKPA
jgi:hypothetical protein